MAHNLAALLFFCSLGARNLGARFDAGLWRGSEVGPLWWLYDPTPSTRPNFIKGRIPRTKRTRSTESPISGRIVTWEAPRSPADARTSHGARRTRRRAHRRDRKSNNSYIYLRAAETAASNRTHSRRGTATTGAEAGDRVTTSPRAAPPASAQCVFFWLFLVG